MQSFWNYFRGMKSATKRPDRAFFSGLVLDC